MATVQGEGARPLRLLPGFAPAPEAIGPGPRLPCALIQHWRDGGEMGSGIFNFGKTKKKRDLRNFEKSGPPLIWNLEMYVNAQPTCVIWSQCLTHTQGITPELGFLSPRPWHYSNILECHQTNNECILNVLVARWNARKFNCILRTVFDFSKKKKRLPFYGPVLVILDWENCSLHVIE